ncbi:hypothetical protein Sjap_011465 [Stephania japonica]|uniref:SAWADEE domain-containing protein n=1 Tax=Stephania japonica TaxID=461633 RepID=A0AAP0JBJ5_9MAGN
MARLRPREVPRFTKAEILEMEETLHEQGDKCFNQDFCLKLARKFSRAVGRAGKPSVQWKLVLDWFEKRKKACAAPPLSLPAVPKELVAPVDTSVLNNGLQNSTVLPQGDKLLDLSDLEFEARSSKDGAWYDVAFFLTHRILKSGEPEALVRFVGFGAEEDEWVNVKMSIRERSIPLEPSECECVKVGDIVLCYQESTAQAIYFDARVENIERKLHDIRGCRCHFMVRYVHDNTEETVRLRRLCRRPSY